MLRTGLCGTRDLTHLVSLSISAGNVVLSTDSVTLKREIIMHQSDAAEVSNTVASVTVTCYIHPSLM